MNTPENDPSVTHEPHLRAGGFRADSSERPATEKLRRESRASSNDDLVEHTVWDEPALSREQAARIPANDLNYSRWLDQRISETGHTYSWLVVAGIALAAGPWGLLGSLARGGQTRSDVLMLTVLGPVLEEMMKVAAALWVVEKRPFLFQSRLQIAVCVLCGGFVFAAVENLLYLKVYVRDPSNLLMQWRWSLCVALHMGCSLIAGLGLMRIWAQTMRQRKRPELVTAAPYMVAAMIVHGTYNGFAVLLEAFRITI